MKDKSFKRRFVAFATETSRFKNDRRDFAMQNQPQFRKKGSFRKAKAMVINMKKKRNEKLSEYLLNVDEDILDNAYRIDDAEKLKQYTQKKNKRTGKPFYMTARFRMAATTAACLVLMIGIVFSFSALFRPDNNNTDIGPDPDNKNHGEVVQPWLKNDDEYIAINSIDKLNYYSAMKVLADRARPSTMSAKGDQGIMLLSAYAFADEDSYAEITMIPGTDENYTENNPSNDKKTPPDIIRYEIDRNELFSVSKVIFFQIKLTDENGFLASKVGTGIVDVVITENNLENMITFRKGDSYYSCCDLSGGPGFWQFSTHKYVEDFCIVKNLEQDNYRFTIKFDRLEDQLTNVAAIECDPFKNGGPNPDSDMTVTSETYTERVNVSFTIGSLEEYLNTGKLPEENNNSNRTEIPPETYRPAITYVEYTNGEHAFVLQSNGTFVCFSTEPDQFDATYRKGEYSRNDSTIEFRFFYKGEIIETVSCDLTESGGFIYEGTEYSEQIVTVSI